MGTEVAARAFADIEIGDELPEFHPDVSMATVKRFTDSAHMSWGRFNDHDEARKQGLPGAIVPGIMSQAILSAVIHGWAPGCQIQKIDTVFRATLLVDSKPLCTAVITDLDSETETIEVDLTIQNEEGETRVMGTASVKL